MNASYASFYFAIAALIVAGMSPLAVGYFARRARRLDLVEAEKRYRQDRKDEEAHRNELAIAAAEVARKLLATNQEVAAKVADVSLASQEVAAKVADVAHVAAEQKAIADQTAEQTKKTLEGIHSLVNGKLLAAMRRELAASRANLDSMRGMVALRESHNVPVLPETVAAIVAVEEQVRALEIEIARQASILMTMQDDDDV